ncbi:MAG: hypothetical protein MUC35_01685 [Candidatus Margulisbacteria bacterium]|jgi:hypothetical protein|nr:hypothetical protein [Candidatus Margulisiibacteriota bacterium]
MGYRPLIIVCLLATQCLAAFDPLTLGVGARSLSLGGANTALVFDADTVFANPAGLGELDNISLTSMAGTVLEDVNYTVLGGVYPLGRQGAFGFGYAGTFVSAIELRDGRGNLTSRANFADSVVIGSFGKKLNEEWSVGGGLKYYASQGTEISSGNRTATTLDLGVLQHGLKWLSLGAVAQNLLASDHSRSFRVGTRMALCGTDFRAARLAPVSLTLAGDASYALDGSRGPTQHYGLEFSPADPLTIRCGSDAGNLTGGLSLRLAGLGFHYAYHAFSGFDGNYAHFFALSFNERGWPAEIPSDAYLAKSSGL